MNKKSIFSMKKAWQDDEDVNLKLLIEKYGDDDWSTVAEMLASERTGKQCRERWINNLNPNVKKGNWTIEEDNVIVKMQRKIGNQWIKITKMLPGRTDNAVKNRFHSIENARLRSQDRGDLSAEDAYALFLVAQQRLTNTLQTETNMRFSIDGNVHIPHSEGNFCLHNVNMSSVASSSLSSSQCDFAASRTCNNSTSSTASTESIQSCFSSNCPSIKVPTTTSSTADTTECLSNVKLDDNHTISNGHRNNNGCNGYNSVPNEQDMGYDYSNNDNSNNSNIHVSRFIHSDVTHQPHNHHLVIHSSSTSSSYSSSSSSSSSAVPIIDTFPSPTSGFMTQQPRQQPHHPFLHPSPSLPPVSHAVPANLLPSPPQVAVLNTTTNTNHQNHSCGSYDSRINQHIDSTNPYVGKEVEVIHNHNNHEVLKLLTDDIVEIDVETDYDAYLLYCEDNERIQYENISRYHHRNTYDQNNNHFYSATNNYDENAMLMSPTYQHGHNPQLISRPHVDPSFNSDCTATLAAAAAASPTLTTTTSDDLTCSSWNDEGVQGRSSKSSGAGAASGIERGMRGGSSKSRGRGKGSENSSRSSSFKCPITTTSTPVDSAVMSPTTFSVPPTSSHRVTVGDGDDALENTIQLQRSLSRQSSPLQLQQHHQQHVCQQQLKGHAIDIDDSGGCEGGMYEYCEVDNDDGDDEKEKDKKCKISSSSPPSVTIASAKIANTTNNNKNNSYTYNNDTKGYRNCLFSFKPATSTSFASTSSSATLSSYAFIPRDTIRRRCVSDDTTFTMATTAITDTYEMKTNTMNTIHGLPAITTTCCSSNASVATATTTNSFNRQFNRLRFLEDHSSASSFSSFNHNIDNGNKTKSNNISSHNNSISSCLVGKVGNVSGISSEYNAGGSNSISYASVAAMYDDAKVQNNNSTSLNANPATIAVTISSSSSSSSSKSLLPVPGHPYLFYDPSHPLLPSHLH